MSHLLCGTSALILAGGFGTRLRPLTLSRPKPLVEFANKPIVLHQIEALAEAGVTQVILAVSYKAKDMETKLIQLAANMGVSLTFSHETEPLGTAGPLALARSLLETGGKPFLVLNSDVICDFPFKQLAEYHTSHGKEGTIVVTKVNEPSKYGVMVYDENGKIENFIEKPQEFISNKINAGIYFLNPSVLKRIDLRAMSIEKEVFPVMARESQLYAMELQGFWMDIGQPKDFLSGIALYLSNLRKKEDKNLREDPSIVGNVLIDSSANIGRNCRLGPDLTIGPNVTIGDGIRIKRSAILEGATIGSHVYLDGTIIGWHSQIGSWVRMENTILGENVEIKNELFITGGQILPHKCVTDSILKPSVIM